jgi:hypothetical protein
MPSSPRVSPAGVVHWGATIHCGVSIVALPSRAPLAETPSVLPHEQASSESSDTEGSEICHGLARKPPTPHPVDACSRVMRSWSSRGRMDGMSCLVMSGSLAFEHEGTDFLFLVTDYCESHDRGKEN